MSGLQLSASGLVPDSEIGGGHANLAWTSITGDRDLTAAWHVSSTATYSSMNQWISAEEYPDGLAGDHFSNVLLADSDLASMDISASGRMLRLPGGALRLALGGGVRSDAFRGSVLSIEPLPMVSGSRTDLNAYGEATVHAPLISQLDTPITSYTTFLPAVPGGVLIDALVINGGSQSLQPEKSSSFTAGIDWAPIGWPQFRGSMTYFNISYNHRIQTQNINATLLDEQFPVNAIVSLNPSVSQVLPVFQAPGFQQDGAGLGPSGVGTITDNQFANTETTLEQGFRLDGQTLPLTAPAAVAGIHPQWQMIRETGQNATRINNYAGRDEP